MEGEESFTDRNGNGRYDAGEVFGDLAEAFNDHNEDGRYTRLTTARVFQRMRNHIRGVQHQGKYQHSRRLGSAAANE